MSEWVIAVAVAALAFVLLCIWACLRVSSDADNMETEETIDNFYEE